MTNSQRRRILTVIATFTVGITAGVHRAHDIDPPANASSAPVAAKRATPRSVVSCYGPGFYGRRTADGTRLERSSILIAHRTLPLGTPRTNVTRVAIAANGKRIVVTVRDRGPYTRKADGSYARDWDVSEPLAYELGFTDCADFGVRKLRVTVLP